MRDHGIDGPPSTGQHPIEPSSFEKRLVGRLVKTIFFRGRRGGPWPLPGGLDGRPLTFAGNSGARLAGLYFSTQDSRGIVVLAHPDRRYGKQWFVREGWIDWLASNGLDSLVFDFPVYGESRGGSTYLHDDVIAACHEARRLRPDLPLHLIGLSIGAFAAANASPRLPFLESMVLESPYPTFDAWYGDGEQGHARINRLMARTFPKTYARIDANTNIRNADATRILIAGTVSDEVTPISLTRDVARASPLDRTTYLELDGVPHLGLFADARYREAVLATLTGVPVGSRTPPAAPVMMDALGNG